MEPDLSALAEYVDEHDLDGYLIDASAADGDQLYLSGFASHDPFVTLWTDGAVHLLVRSLDRALAREQSRATTVASGAEYGLYGLMEEHGRSEARRRVLDAFLEDHGVEAVAVPERFPVSVADDLRGRGKSVTPDTDGVVSGIRAVKTDEEVAHIRSAQRATERAMASAEELLAAATVDGDVLVHSGTPLTSERVKAEIETTLVRQGCHLDETIVAGGEAAANPHDRGSGPLPAHKPIVIDVFPRDGASGYHADMTRTFCVGAPDETAAEWYRLTLDAQEAAFDHIAPGVTGEAVHEAVCDVYEAAGIPTTREDEGTETGFIHGTGHGLGLDVHERPSVSSGGGELEPGHVVTVEPGVYDPAVGGIRIEDLVVVTADGFDNLTEYGKSFHVGQG